MLKLSDIRRKLGSFVLSGINLEVPDGQYYVLLGRSGSGKTQLLELIAGLEHPDGGTVFLDGEDITRKRIQDRRIGIVFQDYAVFPHMTVYGNLAYPLRAKRIAGKLISEKVMEVAKQLNILHLLDRATDNLSGGERQRVALARTLVTSPRLLLLDEPLSSLDASLKDDMKKVLRRLNRDGQTIIHVSHDYHDALSLARRVGVIHNGRIIQEGPPDEVFRKPANRFVARYAGIRNFFSIRLENNEGFMTGFTMNNLKIRVAEQDLAEKAILILKSDDIMLTRERPEDSSMNIFKGTIEEIIPSEYGMEVILNAGEIFHAAVPKSEYERLKILEGEEIWTSFPVSAAVIINGQSE